MLNRVTASSGLAGLTRAYTYDLDGNRLPKTENGTTTCTATFEATDQATTMTKSGGSPSPFAYTEFGSSLVGQLNRYAEGLRPTGFVCTGC